MSASETEHDVVVVGGGPAGLSAALVLGRARKKTLLLDDGTPRNARAPSVHGYLGHDGIAPGELRRIAHAELERYPDVQVRPERAVSVERADRGRVRVTLASGATAVGRRVLLVPGLIDVLPKIPGVSEVWGRSAFSCPYCHGWENRDRTWGVLALQKNIVNVVPILVAWTSDVVVFANGRTDLPDDVMRKLTHRRIRLEPRKVISLITEGDELSAVEVEGGERVPCGAMLLHPAQRHVDVVLFAGLALDAEGCVQVDNDHASSMSGVHVAGDAAAGANKKAIAAAADGAAAAIQIAEILTAEDFAHR